jgi:hypothetical protein
MPAVVAPLSRIERGMLGGLAAAALVKLGLACGIEVSPTEALEIAPDAIGLCVSASVDGEQGQVWLCAAPTALGRAWEGVSSEWAPAPLRLELARTSISRSEAAAASEGDVVVFDETAGLSSSSSWPLQLCCSGRLVYAVLSADGRVSADERTTGPAVARHASTGDGDYVDVTAEIAHAAALDSPDGYSALSPRGDGALLRMGETDWAEGALCEVAGSLAVRITRTLAG